MKHCADSVPIINAEGFLARQQLLEANAEAVERLARRALEKGRANGEEYAVILIDADDPAWAALVDALMPGEDWDAIRARGLQPCARGVVPRRAIAGAISAAMGGEARLVFGTGKEDGDVDVFACAGGGASVFIPEPPPRAT